MPHNYRYTKESSMNTTKFRMYGIHLDQFAILCKDCKNEIGMNVSLNFKYANDGKKIACITTFHFSSETQQVMVLGITCEFEIQEEDWNLFCKETEVRIPKELLEFFAVHTIGTARGILFCKTESTPFNHIIIPPVNVSEMELKDLVIKREQQV